MKILPVEKDGQVIGYVFMCPGCGCGHQINLGWSFNGSLDKPTIIPSILVNGRQGVINPTKPRCHSFVTDGKISYLSDCTHDMAGQTIDLPDA